jgi:multiple sugar transport system permease protein
MPYTTTVLNAQAISWIARLRGVLRRESSHGYIFISPWVIGFLLFGLVPMLLTFYNSFTDSTLFKTGEWVGFDNYERLFTSDPTFTIVLGNMALYVAVSIPLVIGLSLFFALLLREKFLGNHAFRTIIYIPSLLVGAASAVLFRQLFAGGEFGLINQFLGIFGIAPLNWLNDSDRLWLAMIALIITNLWFLGGTTIIFLAGLHAISQDYYEAARIDGAGSWKLFTRITLPLLSPTLVFNTIMVIIGQLQAFDMPLVFARGTANGFNSGGSPLGYKNSMAMFLTYIYERAFVKSQMGYASAVAVIVFLLTLGLALFVLFTAKRFTYFGDQERAVR